MPWLRYTMAGGVGLVGLLLTVKGAPKQLGPHILYVELFGQLVASVILWALVAARTNAGSSLLVIWTVCFLNFTSAPVMRCQMVLSSFPRDPRYAWVRDMDAGLFPLVGSWVDGLGAGVMALHLLATLGVWGVIRIRHCQAGTVLAGSDPGEA